MCEEENALVKPHYFDDFFTLFQSLQLWHPRWLLGFHKQVHYVHKIHKFLLSFSSNFWALFMIINQGWMANLNSAKMFTSLVINNNYYMKLWDHYPASVRRFLVITEKVGSLESFCCSVRHQADAKKEKNLRKKNFFKEVVWNLFSLNHR